MTENKESTKPIRSIRAADDVWAMLIKLCSENNRTQGNQIEQLIKDAFKKSGLKLDKPKK